MMLELTLDLRPYASPMLISCQPAALSYFCFIKLYPDIAHVALAFDVSNMVPTIKMSISPVHQSNRLLKIGILELIICDVGGQWVIHYWGD